MSRTPADRAENEGRVLAPLTRSCRLWADQEAALEGLGVDGFSARIRAVVDLGLAVWRIQIEHNQPLLPPAVQDLDSGEGLRIPPPEQDQVVSYLRSRNQGDAPWASARAISDYTGLDALEVEMELSALVDQLEVAQVGDRYRLVDRYM